MKSRYKKPSIPLITAWSYSRWRDYEQCPLRAKLKYVDKLQEPSAPALERGTAIHLDGEQYLKGIVKTLPESLVKLAKQYRFALTHGAIAEEQWAINRDWESTGYFDPDCWLRVKVDHYFFPKRGRMVIVDLKTGQVRDDYEEQLELYATVALLLYDAKEVICENWYADHGVVRGGEKEGFVYKPDDLPELLTLWNDRTKRMLLDTKFEANPNNGCRWCHFRKSNGGPCRY